MKKQLRRKLAVIMAAAIALSAAGCGKSDKAAEEPVREDTPAEQAEETKAKEMNLFGCSENFENSERFRAVFRAKKERKWH